MRDIETTISETSDANRRTAVVSKRIRYRWVSGCLYADILTLTPPSRTREAVDIEGKVRFEGNHVISSSEPRREMLMLLRDLQMDELTNRKARIV